MPLLQDYNKLFEHTDNIKRVYVNDNVVWPIGPDYTEPFYVKNISDEVMTLVIGNGRYYSAYPTVEKSTDKINWETVGRPSYNRHLNITIPAGEKIYLRSKTSYWGPTRDNYIPAFMYSTSEHKVGGNIMSLLQGDTFEGKEGVLTSTNIRAFCGLFNGGNAGASTVNNLIDASRLLLPGNTSEACFKQMFYNCVNLTKGPKLPATSLSVDSYHSMFMNCESLIEAPQLPAKTLVTSCYSNMLRNCITLTTPPALPATSLADYCYENLFYGCEGLLSTPALPATSLADYCYKNMFYGDSSFSTVPTLPATVLTEGCYYGMFSGCSYVTSAPDLPATTLTDKCYYEMFKGTRLSSIKCLATDISALDCTTNWLRNLQTGPYVERTFYCANGMSSVWPTNDSGIPSGWTVVEI